MIQVNRIYLIFNRLVTKKFLVDTSELSTIDLTLFIVIFLIFNEIFIRLYRTYVKYRNYQIKGYV